MAQLITWAITLVVIRILTPADYGLLAMASVFVAFLATVSEFGLGPAIVQNPAADITILRRVFGVVLCIHALLAGLVFLAAPLLARFFGEPRLVVIVQVLSFQFVIAAFAVVPDALLQRKLDFRRRSLLDLSSAIAGSVTTLALALSGQGVWSLIIGSLLAQAWKAVGINIVAPFAHWPAFSIAGLRALVAFGGNTTGAQILWFIYTQIDVVIAGRWLGKELVGFYTVAMHLASLPNQRIAGIINQIAFPAFAHVQHDMNAVGRHLLLGVRALGFVAFPVLWGLSSVAPEVVTVILGAKWGPATLPIQVLGLIMPLRMISNFVPNAVQGIGRSDILLQNAAFAALVAPIAFLVGIQWNLLGLCIAWLVWVPVVFLQSMLRSLPVLGLNLGKLLRAMLPSAGACILMYAAVTVLRPVLASSGMGAPLRLGFLVLAGVVAYVAASLAFNRVALREVLGLVRDALGGRKGISA